MNRKLKNWIVIGKSVKSGKKGLLTYLTYLTNNQHKNHDKESHEIINFQNQEEVFINMCKLVEDRQTKQLLYKNGGRPSNKFGHSFTINFPFKFDSAQQEKKLIQNLLYRFFRELNESENLKMSREDIIEHLKNNNFYNIHRQDKGSQTQFNFVLTEYVNNNKIDLSKKKYSYLLKNISNEMTRKIGFDINKYEMEKKTEKPQRKRVKTSYYKVDKQKEKLEEYKNNIDIILEDTIEKIQKRVLIYLDRMAASIEDKNEEKFNKNKELLEKNIEKIKVEKKKKSSFDIDI